MNTAPIICANCGRPIPAGARFCEGCGAPVPSAPAPYPNPQNPVVSGPGLVQPPYNQPPQPAAAFPPPPAYAPPPGWSPAPAPLYPQPQYYRPMPYRRSGGGGGWCIWSLVGCLVLAVLTCCGLIVGGYSLQRSGLLTSWLEKSLGSQFNPVETQIYNAIETQGIDALTTPGIIPLPTFENIPTLESFPTLGINPQPTEIPTSSGGSTTFSDDFSSQNKGWKIETTKDYSVQYENGQLAVKVITEGSGAFVQLPIQFEPTTLEFSVQIAPNYQTGTLGYYEVMCDYQDAMNYHTIAIDPDANSYTFALIKDGKQQSLTSPEWKKLSADIPSLRDNPAKIMVECTGGSMTLFVNDVYQDQITETTFTSGKMQIGLRLWQGSPYPNGFKILIDNLTAFKPVQ